MRESILQNFLPDSLQILSSTLGLVLMCPGHSVLFSFLFFCLCLSERGGASLPSSSSVPPPPSPLLFEPTRLPSSNMETLRGLSTIVGPKVAKHVQSQIQKGLENVGPKDGSLRSFTLKQLVEMGIENSPRLRIFQRELQIKNLQEESARYAFFPTLSLTATQGYVSYQNHPDGLLAGPNSYFELALNQNLYDRGLTDARYQLVQVQRKISESVYQEKRELFCLNLASQYLKYSIEKANYETREAHLKIIDRQYKMAKTQYQQGLRTRIDYLRLQAERRSAEVDLEKSKLLMSKQKLDLARSLAMEGINDTESESWNLIPIKAELQSLDSEIPKSLPNLANSPRIRINELGREESERNKEIVSRENLPEVQMNLGFAVARRDYLGNFLTGTSAGLNNFYSQGTAGLSIKWDLWDWGGHQRNVTIGELQRQKTLEEIQSSGVDFQLEIRQFFLDIQTDYKDFNLNKELLVLKDKTYVSMEKEYREGRVPYIDLMNDLRSLMNTKNSLNTIYFRLKEKIFQHKYYEGRLYEYIQSQEK